MDLKKRASELYNIPEPHYNCAQSVFIPFAEELGLDHQTMYRVAAQFGGGMRRGSVCGAVTGGLMALGLRGADNDTALAFQRLFQERTGALDCDALLQSAKDRGEEKKSNCDRMILTAVELVEELTGGKKD